ncbi:MAG: hypothetical protein ACTHLW_08895, partial [Verrucomicrobiota bacterium]
MKISRANGGSVLSVALWVQKTKLKRTTEYQPRKTSSALTPPMVIVPMPASQPHRRRIEKDGCYVQPVIVQSGQLF